MLSAPVDGPHCDEAVTCFSRKVPVTVPVPAAEYASEIFYLPEAPVLLTPLLALIPLQIFACELAGAKGNDVDQPRNLAKSVTVE